MTAHNDDDVDRWDDVDIRLCALTLVARLPTNQADALATIGYMREFLNGFVFKSGGEGPP
jgi:hypothetical protein